MGVVPKQELSRTGAPFTQLWLWSVSQQVWGMRREKTEVARLDEKSQVTGCCENTTKANPVLHHLEAPLIPRSEHLSNDLAFEKFAFNYPVPGQAH